MHQIHTILYKRYYTVASFKNGTIALIIIFLFVFILDWSLTTSQASPTTLVTSPINTTQNISRPKQQGSSPTIKPSVRSDYWTKEIQQAGDGVTFASKGDKIEFHYSAFIGQVEEGVLFDSSVQSPSSNPLEGYIGVGSFIRGFDEALLTMSVGERAILEIQYQYAYGENGHLPLIPPRSMVSFDVQLLKVIPMGPKRLKEKSVVIDTIRKLEQKSKYSKVGIYNRK